jgi:splicing factor 3A subunit 3
MGKRHIKLAEKEVDHDAEMEEKERREFREKNEGRRKNLAFLEFRVSRMREELASVIYNTMNLVRKKQTVGYEEVEEVESEESSEEEADAPVYNPKNLPLGWDGKPIPYWLYKLHGLGIEYKCEICGNYSYWGRRAFEMHFQEWRHTYGMKCLKIPNTIHFKDITTINDALALH